MSNNEEREGFYTIEFAGSDSNFSQVNVDNCKSCQQDSHPNRAEFVELKIPLEYTQSDKYPIDAAQKWLTLTGKNGRQHMYPAQTIMPKVQMLRHVPRRQLPRDVEVDRRRRQYQKIDLLELLQQAGVTDNELRPVEDQYELLSTNAFEHHLPIGFFDDYSYDCHSPEAWLQLGYIAGESKQYPLPAKAYLPKNQSLLNYVWQYASVWDYNAKKKLWRVYCLEDEQEYWVPKIRFIFFAENPYVFVQRLQQAIKRRNLAEKVLKAEVIVDVVLMEDVQSGNFRNWEPIEKMIAECKGDAYFKQLIRQEIFVLYQHLMASYEFEHFIKMMPAEFPALNHEVLRLNRPKAVTSFNSYAERQKIQALKLDLSKIMLDILQEILYYIFAGFEAMMNVAIECRYIETLNMFVVQFAKPLPLADFLAVQQQHSTSTATYLKVFWPTKIASGIIIVLRPQGRGWLDISLKNWRIFEMAKIKNFIQQVKYRMQESMHYLLEKSVETFINFLTNPCKQFLKLSERYVWPKDDYINTPFPWPKPVFSLIIGVAPEKRTVIYSTPPEDFEPQLMDIFKKVLEKTSGVRRVDAEVMSQLRFAPNLYILTVELIEDLYIEVNALLQKCYHKAIIPLVAYAKLFRRFVDFYLLDLSDYMKAYAASKPTSTMVKANIIEHKRCKEELRRILPATITIGPFLVIVDPMKQFMIKKRIEVVRRLFEFYVQRMYDINERLLESCVEIYTKINERPQSIEHLFAIRDFAATVPDRVEDLRGEIQVMMLEYEMLDGFFYNLSDQQFAMKWEVYAWPHNIMQRLSTLREEQKDDIEDFKRLHLSEVIGLEERLESLNEEIQAFSLQFDPNRVAETSVDVKKTWKVIQELQRMADTLKFRQELFEMEPLSTSFLDSIITGFNPYRNLWLTCADFLKLEEATTGNPLNQVELQEVRDAVAELKASLQQSFDIFEEKPEVQNVATVYLEKLNEFDPVINCIEWLTNEHWLFMHWQELAARSGMEIKYSASMNFTYCVRKGIMEHLDLVKEISFKAENEAEAIRLAFEEEERRKEEEKRSILLRKELRKCRRDIL